MIPSKVEDLTVKNKGNLIFDPGPPPLALTSGKNFIVTRPAVPEILEGVVFHPPNAINVSKRADAISR